MSAPAGSRLRVQVGRDKREAEDQVVAGRREGHHARKEERLPSLQQRRTCAHRSGKSFGFTSLHWTKENKVLKLETSLKFSKHLFVYPFSSDSILVVIVQYS